MRFKNNNVASLSKKLVAYSVAAGAVAVGAASPAQGALQVFDHSGSPLSANMIYAYYVGATPHDAAVLYMDGTFKRSTDDGTTYTYYDQDGQVTTPIVAGDKTADSVWFNYQDFKDGGGKGMTGVFLQAGGAGAVAADPIGGQLRDGSPIYEVYNSDWTGLESVATEVDSNLNFPASHAVVFGNGGGGGMSDNGWGWGGSTFATNIGFEGTGFVGFSLLEADGLHYGWVQVATTQRPCSMNILGWGYETIPGMAAELTYDPPSGDPGDVDGDGDVDADDIDDLCDNIPGGDLAIYDLDTDGDVDEDDLTYLIENLAEWDNGVDTGEGTKRGDFNLDGLVNATDLAIMKGTFGTSGVGYADGNANCDDVVNATDLAILKGTFGSVAPTGGVPEPATLSLLALGATGLAAKRRRRN